MMTKRIFNLQKRLIQNRTGGIMDIPHPAVLRYSEPRVLIAQFEEAWGIKPEAVVLPVATSDGLMFEVEGLHEPISPYATELTSGLRDFQGIVFAFSRLGLDIYLLITPTLQFIRTDALHVTDIVGNKSPQLCISNPRSQDIIAAVLGTGVDLIIETTKNTPGKLKGVVMNIVDIWPMGGHNKRLKLTCFCTSCEKHIEEHKPGLIKHFKTFPNPWNLLLQVTSTGIAYIDEIHPNSTPSDIIGLSRQRGFDEVFEDRTIPFLMEQADILLDYIEVRHNQTIAAVATIFEQALQGLDSVPRRIILTEGSYYDWTSGIQLESLDRPFDEESSPYDEIWFDPSSTELVMKYVPFRSYMWKRARYYIDAFFDLIANATDPVKRATTRIAHMKIPEVRGLLKSRLNQAIGTAMTGSTSLVSLSDIKSENSNSARIGFVGVSLTREIGDKLIESLNIPPGLADLTSPSQGGDLLETLMRLMGYKEKEEE
jgi:hypothetical protein